MTVYLDLVVLLNFLVDFLLISGTNRLSGFPAGMKRAVLAAALGGIYSGACLMPSFRFLGNTLWRLVSLGLIGVVAFGWNQTAGKRTGVFVLLSMAMGGVALGLGRSDFSMLILSAVLVWGLCRIGFGNRIGGREFVQVRIQEGDVSAELTALRDTGNCLRDPITGEQVLIIGPDAAEKLTGIPKERFASPMETLLARPVAGLRLIPYSAVGQPGSMLLAKRFQKVQIGDQKGSVLVAFAPAGIGQGDVYQALTC